MMLDTGKQFVYSSTYDSGPNTMATEAGQTISFQCYWRKEKHSV